MSFIKDLEKELRPEIDKILYHPFLIRIAKGDMNLEQLQYFAIQYAEYCYHFPRFLASTAANIPDDQTRMPIIENLWEEHGSGKFTRSHRQLYNKFLEALYIDPKKLKDFDLLPDTLTCVQTIMDVCKNHHYIESLGALGPGTEFFTNDEYEIIFDGLDKSPYLTQRDLKFWKVHISLDVEHYGEMVEILYPFLDKAENRKMIREGAFKAIQMEQLFWSGLERNIPI
jgi:pyrroloquinoline-quinone synthase